MDAEKAWTTAEQRQEMSLGLNNMKFQYLHILILLLKNNDSYYELRLRSAREALSLLPSMVSNWSSVYNGVIWYLANPLPLSNHVINN
jgi:hypothetical protein